jgi:hypothetical protein
MPAPQNEPGAEHFDEKEFPPLKELLKYATLEQILYGVPMSMEGGQEISYVDTEVPAEGPANPPPPKAESA